MIENTLHTVKTLNMFPFHQAYGKKKWKILELLIFMAKNTPKLSTMVGENFRITHLKWLKMHLNYPPWLEKC